MWSLVCFDRPDVLVVDQSKAYTSKVVRDSLEAHDVNLDETPIKTPGIIGNVKQYHASLRLSYERISAESNKSATHEECLDLAVSAINCTAGPEKLCPALLVIGAIPRLASMTLTPTQTERARLIDSAMKKV